MISAHYTRCVALIVSLVFFGVLWPNHARGDGRADSGRSALHHRQANESAKILVSRGEFGPAAEALDAVSLAPRGSAQRDFEIAQRLTQLAAEIARDGDRVTAKATAACALQHLAKAEQKTSDPDLKSAIYTQAGLLNERFMGDLKSAKTAYSTAARLASRNTLAQEKLENVDQAESNVRAKVERAQTRR